MNLQEFETLLIARRVAVIEGLASSDGELSSIQSARSGAVADDEHDPEGSTLSTDWSRIAGLHAEAAAQLHEIDEALERVRAKAYGVCASCGRPIPVGRLRVRPWARQCVACASR